MAWVLSLSVSYFYYPTILIFCMVFFLFALVNDEPEVFLSKYSQTAIFDPAHFQSVIDK